MSRNSRNDPCSSAPLEKRVGSPRVTVLQRGVTRSVDRCIQMDADGEFPEEFRGGFREPFEGISSKSIILLIPKMCLKPTDFRKHSETFETTPLECPPQVAGRRLPGNRATRVGHRAPRAAASRAPLLGSSLEASGPPSRSRFLTPEFLAWPRRV